MKMTGPLTFWAIDFDVDSYLAGGGKMLDLALLSWTDKVELEYDARCGRVSEDTLRRMGRVSNFLDSVAKIAPSKASIGSTLSEERLQSIWQSTANE